MHHDVGVSDAADEGSYLSSSAENTTMQDAFIMSHASHAASRPYVSVICRDIQHALLQQIIEKIVFAITAFTNDNAVPAIITFAMNVNVIAAVTAICSKGRLR